MSSTLDEKLRAAVARNDFQEVRSLLDAGANPNARADGDPVVLYGFRMKQFYGTDPVCKSN